MNAKWFLKSNFAIYMAENNWDVSADDNKNGNVENLLFGTEIHGNNGQCIGEMSVRTTYEVSNPLYIDESLTAIVAETFVNDCDNTVKGKEEPAEILRRDGCVFFPHNPNNKSFEDSRVQVTVTLYDSNIRNLRMADYTAAAGEIYEKLVFLNGAVDSMVSPGWDGIYFPIEPVIGTVKYQELSLCDEKGKFLITGMTGDSMDVLRRYGDTLFSKTTLYRYPSSVFKDPDKNCWVSYNNNILRKYTVCPDNICWKKQKSEFEKVVEYLKGTTFADTMSVKNMTESLIMVVVNTDRYTYYVKSGKHEGNQYTPYGGLTISCVYTETSEFVFEKKDRSADNVIETILQA